MASILSETKLDVDHVEHVDQAVAMDVIIDEIETVNTGNFIWLAKVSNGWRYMVGLGGVPSAILFCLLPFVPESRRQLIFHGHREQARKVLEMIYCDSTPAMVDDKIRRIAQAVDQSKGNLDSKSRWAAVKKMHADPACFRHSFVPVG